MTDSMYRFDPYKKSVRSNKTLCVIIGSCQCCTQNIEISDYNKYGFFGHFLDVYRKILLTSLVTSQNKTIRFCFSLSPLQLWEGFNKWILFPKKLPKGSLNKWFQLEAPSPPLPHRNEWYKPKRSLLSLP